MKLRLGNMTKEEKGWILYDWANSVYATIMMAAVFPTYFTSVTDGLLGVGNGAYWWGIGTSASMFLIAILSPFVGALADYKGNKRKLFLLFFLMGLVFTALCAATDNWVGMLIGYALSHVGFSGGNLVYDTFLPDITTNERMDTVSGYGFAFGYIGGSTIPFLVSIALIQFGSSFGVDTPMAIKISLVITVIWWGLFTIPFLKNVKQTHYLEQPKGSVLKSAFIAVGKTAKKIFQNKAIFFFLIAYFFYIDGVGTVINMSTSYGATLGLDTVGMILALLVTQLVAFPCSILFSRLSGKYGSLRMLSVAILLYLVICTLGFFMGFGLEEEWFGIPFAQGIFWLVAFMVGMVQGGIQATSRSHFGKMVPPENAGEFFGFFDIFGKFASVLGPLLYAFTFGLTGRSSLSILSIVLLFLVALVIMGVKRDSMRVK